MSKISPARLVAVGILSQLRLRDARARDVLRDDAALASLGRRDVSLAVRLVLGVTATRGSLDEVIDAHLTRRHIDPRVRDCLRCSSYELLWMATPAPVVVSQGVELVRSFSPHASGLANAVLRRISELRQEWDQAYYRLKDKTASLDDCARCAGMPLWLAERVQASLTPDAFYAFVEAQREAAPVYVATLSTKHSISQTYEMLQSAGLKATATALPGSFELQAPAGLAASGLVQDTDIAVCDLAAQSIACIAAPAPNTKLLEIGQGRATKTLLLHSALHTQHASCSTVSVELHPGFVELAKKRLTAAHIQDAHCIALDARRLRQADIPELLQQSFDTVFVDAPCSGTGTMRRHPEIVWSLTPEALDSTHKDSLPQLQLDMLCAAASKVKRGGYLLYSTCSVLREENEEVVARFMASEEGAGFRYASIMDAPYVQMLPSDAQAWIRSALGSNENKAYARWSPAPASCDGHFCCRMKKL